MCWLFHKWGKWEEFKQGMGKVTARGIVRYIIRRQRRVCEKCGKIQEQDMD